MADLIITWRCKLCKTWNGMHRTRCKWCGAKRGTKVIRKYERRESLPGSTKRTYNQNK